MPQQAQPATDLQAEATDLLARLLRIDTVNPPGDELPAQELLAALLRDAGFEVTLVGRTPSRPNLVARLRGSDDGPTLCLLSHVDTVLAHASEWQRDPWGGEVVDGVVWGRGALDMKNQTAAEVVAATSLAREGWRPARGDLLVVSVADEEAGGVDGAIWLCENHPELVRCDFVVNEGAGAVIPFGDERLYGVCVAEKGVFRFDIVTSGVAGHASNPRMGDNALLKLAPLLDAMATRQPSFDVTAGPLGLLRDLGLEGDPAEALAQLRARDPVLAMMVEPQLGVTLAPTMVSASEKINVIPSRARISVDCRTPPGIGEDVVRRRIAEVLGDSGYEIEFTEHTVGNGSPVTSPLMDAISGWVEREDPGARVVPVLLPAYTDSRTFRAAFPDCVAYGFFPMVHTSLYESWPLVHAPDERIDVRDLGAAARCYRDITLELLG
jgi:acetylornithine deacetylase/succinyl-diaminopimelate desuccinylase-like protein